MLSLFFSDFPCFILHGGDHGGDRGGDRGGELMSIKARGSIRIRDGKIYARLTYNNVNGKRTEIWRSAETRTEAREILKRLARELEDHGSAVVEAAQMTFNELADYVETRYLIPPQYVDGRKVAGLRSHYTAKSNLQVLRSYFGNRKLRSITRGDLEKFKADRLATPTRTGKQRAIASVNRELALLSKMLKIAQAEGWILKNPLQASSLISLADEKKRERVLTREEEERLLAACCGHRAHLRPIIICALDTGMRRGEILKLRWTDIDFTSRVITVRSLNTKTLQQRQLVMTSRLERALRALYQQAKSREELVFGIKDNVKNSFDSVRKAAGLTDLRFHDLRHTAATRLVSKHLPLSEVGRVLGHTQPSTTYRYVNLNLETARRAAIALEGFQQEQEEDSDTQNQAIN